MLVSVESVEPMLMIVPACGTGLGLFNGVWKPDMQEDAREVLVLAFGHRSTIKMQENV